MTEKFQSGKHCKTTILEFVELELLDVTTDRLLSNVEVTKDSVVVDSSNQKENLGPSEEGNRIDGGDTVGNVRELEARSNLTREAINLLDHVSNNCQHTNTSVLELRGPVLIKSFLRNRACQSKWIKVASRLNHSIRMQ